MTFFTDSEERRGGRQREDLPATGAASWLDAELDSVAGNLAIDEALLDEAHESATTGTVVRTWMATKPAVVLGSSSRVDEEVDLAACARLGVEVVRRPTGGLAVVIGPGCVMWSVIAARPAATASIETLHARMLDPLCAALAAAGRMVVRRGSSDLAITAVDGDRKVSGNALRVRRQTLLYHGTLLDSFDLGLVARVLRHPPREPGYRGGRGHADFLANLHLGRARLEAAVRSAFGAVRTRRAWPGERAERLMQDRYLNAAWIHRDEAVGPGG